MQIVNNWSNIELFRPACWLCGGRLRHTMPLCPACHALLPHNLHHCQRCALPLPAGQSTCGQCLKRAPTYDHSLIPFVYARPLDQWISGLKFHQRLAHARLLGELMGLALPASALAKLDVLIPVPLHPRRLRQRGYNQALEIGRFIASRHHLQLAPQCCQRIRHTHAQSDLPLAQRRHNLRRAFEANSDLSGCRVGILDDVVTSGHTVNEMAHCLRKAGAESITVIAVARADLPG